MLWVGRIFSRLMVSCLLVGAFGGLALTWAAWDFELIMRKAELRYGNLGSALERLMEWRDLLGSDQRMPELEKLRMVNLHFNRQLRFSDDIRIWGQRDYWATPVEALVKGAADCEDYALAKYFSLRQLGVPASKLRITYVKALRLNQAHMVLTYYSSPKAEPLVLDNLINEIRPARQRDDLLPVYAFNAEGVYLVKQQGLERTSDAKRLSRWQDLLRKMQGEGFSF
ncbi:cysteine protease LapG [Pseudomonas sp. C11]|uniref:cysteine protease LapG n=1 Tax=Pseudomonas sp. C11 TaxID=3075550 RepID=UPI003A521301